MARPKKLIPTIRPHSSGQARVTIEGKDYLLGPIGSPEADKAYQKLIGEWLAKDGRFAVQEDDPVTIAEVIAGYWLHAEVYYGYRLNPKRGDCCNLKSVMAILDKLYGQLPAKDFGPLCLRAVQDEMICRGWCRNLINQQSSRIKSIFRWAVAEELVPESVWHRLLSVRGLQRGRTEAKETEDVQPVPMEDIEAIRPKLRPAVRAMIDFMLLTGCRPNEACQLRAIDIDRTDASCWTFRPEHHKTQHHGQERIILIGPKAQQVLMPFLDGCAPDDWIFSPRREEEKRNAERMAKRKSRRQPSQVARMEKARTRTRARKPKEYYTTSAMRRAVHRACELAKIKPFGVNRLRHTRATELRPHGLDVVGTILGHSRLETTQIYSERNLAAAKAVVAKVG